MNKNSKSLILWSLDYFYMFILFCYSSQPFYKMSIIKNYLFSQTLSFSNHSFTTTNNTISKILKLWDWVDLATNFYSLRFFTSLYFRSLISNIFHKRRSNLFGSLFIFYFVLFAFPDLSLALSFHLVIDSSDRFKIFNSLIILF